MRRSARATKHVKDDADTEMLDGAERAPETTRANRGRAATAAAAPESPSEATAPKRPRTKSPGEEEKSKSSASAPRISAKQKQAQEQQRQQLLLESFTTPLVGRLFDTTSVIPSSTGRTVTRPPLPTVLLHSACEFLAMCDLASNLACTSRGAYASMADYGRAIQNRLKKHSPDEIDLVPYGWSSVYSSTHQKWKQKQTSVKDQDGVTLLCASRLRTLVSRLDAPPLDAKLLDMVTTAMPNLHSMTFMLYNETASAKVRFPPVLHELNLILQFQANLLPISSAMRARPANKMWTTDTCHKYVMSAMDGVGALEHLRTFSINLMRGQFNPVPEWLDSLAKLPHLHTLHLDRSLQAWNGALSRRAAVQLRSIPSLTRLSDGAACQDMSGLMRTLFWSSVLPHLLAADTTKPNMPLIQINLENETCDDDLRLALMPLAGTLTSICPGMWAMADCSWLADFSELKQLSVVTSDNFDPTYGITFGNAPPVVPEPLLLVGLEVAVASLQKLTWLRLTVPTLRSEQLEQMARALPLLTSLDVSSKAVDSLGWIAASPHLSKRLQSLTIYLPAVPRDESSQLLSLSALEELDISGSFSEPLFAKQLFPFLPPYPSAALHWLRKFTPRSSNEPVPTPPIDLVAKAAAVVDFDARVRAGEVRAAERMNSSQLSLVFQFLDVRDFSFSARTCRSWRSAASLPSAWSVANTSDAGRVLVLRSRMPQCDPAILPTLPLWKNARLIDFSVSHLHLSGSSQELPGLTKAFASIAMLPRVESLRTYINSTHLVEATKSCFFQQLAPRLRWADLGGVQPSDLMLMERMRVLTLRYNQAGPGAELGHLHQLVELSLVNYGCDFAPELGDTLRRLSVHHSLRSLTVDIERLLPQRFKGVGNFFASLAAAPGEPAASMQTATISSLDDDVPNRSDPAALTSLTLLTNFNAPALEMRHVLRLPQLRSLRIRLNRFSSQDKQFEYDFGGLASLAASGQLSPLESLDLYVVHRGETLLNLAHLIHLKSLRATTALVPRWTINGRRPPAGCLDRWVRCMPLLESLELGVQLQSNEFSSLDRLHSLKSLSLVDLDEESLTLADLDVLPRCVRLENLTLERIAGLQLLKPDWMDTLHARLGSVPVLGSTTTKGVQRQDENQAVSAMEIDESGGATSIDLPTAGSSPLSGPRSSAYPDLIHILSACPSLRSFSLILSDKVISGALSYTLQNTRTALKQTQATFDARRPREHARMRQALRQLSQSRSAATPLQVSYGEPLCLLACTSNPLLTSGRARQTTANDERAMTLEVKEEEEATEVIRAKARGNSNPRPRPR